MVVIDLLNQHRSAAALSSHGTELPVLDVTGDDAEHAKALICSEYGCDWGNLAETAIDPLRATDLLSDLLSTSEALQCRERQLLASQAQLEAALEQIAIIQNAIAHCSALKEWGRCDLKHVGYQVVYILNLYQGSISTINALCRAADKSEIQPIGKATMTIPQFPHCDPRILHAPGTCEFCDMHPDWQQLREFWEIAFTGGPKAKNPDPATAARGLDSLNSWPGNRASVSHPEEIRVLAIAGTPVVDDSHKEIDPASGMQKDYVVLDQAERNKGFVRPLRTKYKHTACGSVTHMSKDIAETYARDPYFYTGTFCSLCRKHLPLTEFVWLDDGTQVGS